MSEHNSPNYTFWDNLVGQDHRAVSAEDARPIPVYLFTNCVNDCDIFIIGASLGLELHRQIKEDPATVRRVPSEDGPVDLCYQVLQFYGHYKKDFFQNEAGADLTPADEESATTAYAVQIVSYFGEGSAEQGPGVPRKVYKGLMSKSKPQNGPSLEIPELNACDAPQGLMYGDNDGPVWLYLVRSLPEDHANIALDILSGEAFDNWQTDFDEESIENSDE